ncbi:elongation factor G [Pontiella agarivorans]|uniref:Elongation factor G n=1 Tax=Pontiella agarivorans TaxID=3038953 RepID=A0ABU5MUF6_9BACT|nr:elongation factor G [Pontiella agarivorans]MDZ8117767.1 elongation factor G [Pontiella agarivorans]
MKNIPIDNVRNFALMGHTGSGKTSLIDSILFKLGQVDRVGSPENGTSVADWTEEEKTHGMTIWAKPFDGVYTAASRKIRRLVMIDTPGFADFIGHKICAAEITDAALITIDAAAGIQVGTQRAWKSAEKRNLPRGIAITCLDKDDTSFDDMLMEIKERWGDERCIPMVLPTSDGKAVDILNTPFSEIPDELKERVKSIKDHLIELAAETDDALIEKYFNGEELSADEFSEGLRKSVHDAHLIPVFATSVKADMGVKETMDSISRLFPSPHDYPVSCAEGNEISADEDQPFSAQIWRCFNDPFVGQMTFIRIYSGVLKPGMEVYNPVKDQKEKISAILYVDGKKTTEAQEAKAGDIVALTKLKNTFLNDSLCAVGSSIKFEPIVFPSPVTAYAVEPKNKADADKIGQALHRATDEDPSIRLEHNTETHELVLWGMGDMHLEVTLEHIKNRSNVDMTHHTPKVAYKETITGSGEGHYKHKKQSGGRGQYGECYIRIRPKSEEEPKWFLNKIVGGAIPGGFIPACEKGFVEGLQNGPLVGSKVINVQVELYDGSYHDVDSSEVAFKIAGSKALHEAIEKSSPVLLEPIMTVKVVVPDQFMGDISGLLNTKRGRILGMGPEDGLQVINADVPQAEMFRFCSELRSLTSGQGSFEMDFARYEQVPAHLASKVISDAKAAKEE